MSANTLKFKLHASNLFGPDLSLEKGSKLKYLEFKEDAADYQVWWTQVSCKTFLLLQT